MNKSHKIDPDAAHDEKRQEAADKGFNSIAEMEAAKYPEGLFFDQAAEITGMTDKLKPETIAQEALNDIQTKKD